MREQLQTLHETEILHTEHDSTTAFKMIDNEEDKRTFLHVTKVARQ